MKTLFRARLPLLGMFLAGALDWAHAGPRLTKSHPEKVLPLDRVVRVSFAGTNNQAMAARKAKPRNLFAEAMPIAFRPRFDGTREVATVDGVDYAVHRVRLYAPGAMSLNLGFSRYHMPVGGSLHIYSAAQEGKEIRAFTSEDNEEHGQLWTPILETDEIVVEVDVPLDSVDALELEIARVNHGFKRFGDAGPALSPEKAALSGESHVSGRCNVDVACPEGNPWRNQIRSVAVYSRSGELFCSGAAVNNVPGDNRPFFLTAFHCGVDDAVAPSVVAYWNFQNSACRAPGSTQSGEAGNGTLTEFNSGSYFRAANSPTDFTLIEFDDPIPSSSKVFRAGWDRSTSNPASAVGIHHPSLAEKRISLENNALTATSFVSDASPGDGTHWRVGKWDAGVTEGGSSGSPLFNPKGLVIGQLHGGFSSCTSGDLRDWYGRFSTSWNGGGTSSSGLKAWLDPKGTNVTSLNGKDTQAAIIAPVLSHLFN